MNNYHNFVRIEEKQVVKRFLRKEDFVNEQKFYQIFSKHFDVARIEKIDNESNTIFYERIRGEPLSEKEVLAGFGVEEILKIRDKVPSIKGKMIENMLTPLLPKEYIDNLLVHGDMRLDNIIVSNDGKTYLIDFEYGNYIFREFDDSYMHLSLIQKDKSKAKAYYDKVANNNDSKTKMLYGELFFIAGVLVNPNIDVITKRRWVEIQSMVISDLAEALNCKS
ncbi:MAG: phosphotransferase [Candidatus Micrarchaeaceae archaeon]